MIFNEVGTYNILAKTVDKTKAESNISKLSFEVQTKQIYKIGDVNGDGKVNIKDWNRMYDHITEVNPF